MKQWTASTSRPIADTVEVQKRRCCALSVGGVRPATPAVRFGGMREVLVPDKATCSSLVAMIADAN